VTVNPIRDWTALEVWLYIIWRKLRYNPLYDEDIERVGCWMCPSALASEYAEIERLTPDIARSWTAMLEDWAEDNGLGRDFVAHGFWRWKELPPKMIDLSERLGISVQEKRADRLDLRLIKGVSPCTAGGYSVDAVLSTPEPTGLDRIGELLKTVGQVALKEDFGVVMVSAKNGSGKVFSGGQISVVAQSPDDASDLFDQVARAVLRASMCTKCGICERSCAKGAIKVDDLVRVDEGKCTRCGVCADSCVVAHYFDKLADTTGGAAAKRKGRRRK
jgi:phosphoadenosine phosphosulfate reductase